MYIICLLKSKKIKAILNIASTWNPTKPLKVNFKREITVLFYSYFIITIFENHNPEPSFLNDAL